MNKFMILAKKEAFKAFKHGDFPVGAVIVKDGKVISKAYNKKCFNNISVYHAEILAIIKACKKLNSWRLNDCTIYVTLEPCPMCMSAIVESRISKIVYLVNSNYYDSVNNYKDKIIKEKLDDDLEYLSLIKKCFDRI